MERIHRYNLYRMNASFALQDIGWLFVRSYLVRLRDEERLTTMRGSRAVHPSLPSLLLTQKIRRAAGLGLHLEARYVMVISQFSLWRWGKASHSILDQSSGMYFLDRCQMKVADMFGLLREKV